jgi:hypothetical protein
MVMMTHGDTNDNEMCKEHDNNADVQEDPQEGVHTKDEDNELEEGEILEDSEIVTG